MEEQDKGYQSFSNLMDTVFEMANELNLREHLTDLEKKFLDAMDEYCASDEHEENEEE